MADRLGIPRQQYQRLERKGNPRLDTLQLVAKGLKSELMLIPEEKLEMVRDILAAQEGRNQRLKFSSHNVHGITSETPDIQISPWKGLLGDENESSQ